MRDPAVLIWAKLHSLGDEFFLLLPNILGGIVFLLFAYFLGRLLERWVSRLFGRGDRVDLGGLLGSIVFGTVLLVAALVACAIVFPSVQPSNVLSTLGIGSVAIGFAFKDILQNLLAGLLLLINRPYRRGDQIQVKGFEGTVEHIESRATLIKTYDGRRVIIPNSDVYTSPVIVNTAFETKRDSYDVGIGYGDDVEGACRIFEEAVAGCEGVLEDPKPEALPWGLDSSYVTVRIRWWAKSLRAEQTHARSRAILAIWRAANTNGIDLPFPTSTILFHDQTEDADGDRSKQREGWPAKSAGAPPSGSK